MMMEKAVLFFVLLSAGLSPAQTKTASDSLNNIPFEVKIAKAASKKLIFLVFVLFSAHFLQAQNLNQLIDKLKLELKTNPDPKRIATIYSDLTWYYSNVSIDSALAYGEKAKAASAQAGDSTLIAQVYSDIGAVYFRKGDLDNSKMNYLRAYNIRKLRNDLAGMAKVNVNLGSIYTDRRQFPPAMKAYLESIKYFENIHDDKTVNTTKMNIGTVFIEMKNYPKAKQYLKEVIAFGEKSQMKDLLCMSYLAMGNAYYQSEDTITARKYYNKSLITCKSCGNNAILAKVYNNIAIMKSDQKKSKEAMAMLKNSANIGAQFNSDEDKITLKINTIQELMRQKKYEKAYSVLKEVRKYYEDRNDHQNLILVYKLLVPVYGYLNYPDSVAFYQNRYVVYKEIYEEAAAKKLTADMETKYQTEKKEKLLLVEQAESRRKSILLLSVSIFAAFLLLVGYLIFRQQQLKRKQQEQEFQLKTAIAQIETQNRLQEQRLNISRDLHDNIGAQLTFIISSVDNIKYSFEIENTKLSDKLRNISEFTKSTILELRDTIWAMNNANITFEDLKVRALNFIEKAKLAKEDIHFIFNFDDNLNRLELISVMGMNIYRTIQEAVNNAIKHADADNIIMEAKLIGNTILLTITDDGKGFDTTMAGGNGLFNMQKRIEDIDGKLTITSSPGSGTQILMLIPLLPQNT